MKILLLIPILAGLTGCVASPYYEDSYQRTDIQYVPSGSTMIYTETIRRPEVIYVQPRPYYRPYYNQPRPYYGRPDYGHRPPHYNGNPHRPPMNNHGPSRPGNGNWNNGPRPR